MAYVALNTSYGNICTVTAYSAFRLVIQIGYDNADYNTGSGYKLYKRTYVECTKYGSTTLTSNLKCSWTSTTYTLNKLGINIDTGWVSLGTFAYGATATYASQNCYYTSGSGVTRKSTADAVSYTVPKPTYTISYDANGGTGASSAQTKTYGTDLTLSSTIPTKTGHAFQGWGTSASDASVDYAAGAIYSANASIKLYAIWKKNTYAVTYDANGGTGAPSAQTKTYGTDLTLSTTKPTRTNYNFLGWGISASATTVSYASGATYSIDAPITLYAVWELAYVVPTVTDFTVTRCNSSGTADDYGTYANVAFKWETCQLVGANNIKSIKIEWKTLSATSYGNSVTVSATGTKGTVSKIIGSGALNVDTIYTVRLTVTDNMNGSTQPTRNVPLAKFIMDVLNGGNGVSFGRPASLAGYLDVDFKSKFRKEAEFNGTATFSGDIFIDDAELEALWNEEFGQWGG